VLQLGDGALLEADVVGLVEDEREVLGVVSGGKRDGRREAGRVGEREELQSLGNSQKPF
jgi:hypothetical protein